MCIVNAEPTQDKSGSEAFILLLAPANGSFRCIVFEKCLFLV
jgi:hypothetical protein